MDQAKGLRQMAETDAMKKHKASMGSRRKTYPRVIAVTSGKGGVGKTNIVGNLAVAMTRMGKRVVIIDADVGLANVDILFNLRPEYNIRHLVNGEKSIDQVMAGGPDDDARVECVGAPPACCDSEAGTVDAALVDGSYMCPPDTTSVLVRPRSLVGSARFGDDTSSS